VSIVLEDRKGGQIWALGRLKKWRSTPTHPPVLQKRAQKVLKTKGSGLQRSKKSDKEARRQ
jgi:hypothetical protein